MASPFANLAHLGCELDRARHARTCAFVERILARPSFAPWVEREAAFLARTAPKKRRAPRGSAAPLIDWEGA